MILSEKSTLRQSISPGPKASDLRSLYPSTHARDNIVKFCRSRSLAEVPPPLPRGDAHAFNILERGWPGSEAGGWARCRGDLQSANRASLSVWLNRRPEPLRISMAVKAALSDS